MTKQTGFGVALARAVADLRTALGDPTAAVVVLSPSSANGVLARQQLALAGPFIRVDFQTPDRLMRARVDGLVPEPPAWLSAVVGVALRDGVAGPYASALRQPGWQAAVAAGVETLEAAGVGPADLLALATPGDSEAARLTLLADLLSHVAKRRSAEGLAGLAAACACAMSSDTWAPTDAVRGVIVLGDRTLPPCLFDFLRDWLATREVLVLDMAPLSNLSPAPNGLRMAVPPGATQRWVCEAAGGALAGMKARLFAHTSGPALADDDTLRVVRTPDEVREVAEVARAVQRAIKDGVPLDQIAVVLPDPAQAVTLAAHLSAAEIPTTWQTGPALTETGPARLLRVLIELGLGRRDTTADWYDLFQSPSLALRARLGVTGTARRGRWRCILTRCGADRGVHLDAAIERWVEAQPTGERGSGARLAAASLRHALKALRALVEPLRVPATLAVHGQRWVAVLSRWCVGSGHQQQLVALLAGLGPLDLGPTLGLDAALMELEALLSGAAALAGRLGERKVLVGSPMLLLGGDFERVFVTGMTQRRFPKAPSEDALLPDAIIERLRVSCGARLQPSGVRADVERRRLAAVVGACTGRLWLSAPRFEMLKGRPQLPGTLLLEVLSAQAGCAVRYEALESPALFVGSRAHAAPRDADDALGEGERLVSQAAFAGASALPALASHGITRRLLGLHRALTAVDDDPPGPWTGAVPPELLAAPGVDGAPLSPEALARLANTPGAFLLHNMLGVYRLRRFRPFDPLGTYLHQDLVLDAAARMVAEKLSWSVAWAQVFDEALAHRPEVGATTREVATELASLATEGLQAAAPTAHEDSGVGSVAPDLPWSLAWEAALADEAGPLALHEKAPSAKKLQTEMVEGRLAMVLRAMASGAETLTVVGLSGARRSAAVATVRTEVLARLAETVERAELGQFSAMDTDLALGGERS